MHRRLQELVEYMKWRSKETLEAYEHCFHAARHAETLDVLHARMHQEMERFSQPGSPPCPPSAQDAKTFR